MRQKAVVCGAWWGACRLWTAPQGGSCFVNDMRRDEACISVLYNAEIHWFQLGGYFSALLAVNLVLKHRKHMYQTYMCGRVWPVCIQAG
jgi:hypothetical protein